MILCVCVFSGRTILLSAGFNFTYYSHAIVICAGTGIGLIILIMVVLGFLHLLNAQTAWIILSAIAAIGALGCLRYKINRPALILRRQKAYVYLFAAVLTAFSFIYLLISLSPTFEGDSIAGYLLVAHEYAKKHCIVNVDYAYTSSYPQNGQMLSTLGFLLHGQILAQLLVSFSMGIVCIGALYAIGRRYFSKIAALIGMAIWYTSASVAYINGSGKIDLAWAAFDMLAILSFCRWYFEPPQQRLYRWLILSGFFLGIAGGIKQASIFTVLVLSCGVAYRLISEKNLKLSSWVTSYSSLALPASLAIIWVIRSLLMRGKPSVDTNDFVNYKTITGFIRVLWEMSMTGNAVSIEGPRGKSIGPAILAVLPLLALVRKPEKKIYHFLAFSGLMLILWFNGVQRARHLLPTLAILSIAAGYVIARLAEDRNWFARIIIICMTVACLLQLGQLTYIQLIATKRFSYIFGRQNFEEYLAVNTKNSKWFPKLQILHYIRNELDSSARIACAPAIHSFYLEKPAYTGWTQNPETDPEAKNLLAELKRKNITHVFINDIAVSYYDHHATWLFDSSFQAKYLKKIICEENQCLYELLLHY
mgnify:CR=1 FL=1